MADEKHPRARSPVWSDAERVEVGARHRTPPRGIPESWEGDDTGQIEDPDARRAARRTRPTDARIDRLEEKHDKVDAKVDKLISDIGETKASLGHVQGQLDGQDRVLGGIQQSLTNLSQREHLRQITITDIEGAKERDKVAAGADKRKVFTTAVVSAIGVIAAIGGALVHYLAGKL